MKKYLLLLLLLPLSISLYARRGSSVVYLKNGSIIHGSVLEMHPDGNIKIETDDGSLFVFPTSDVIRLVVESAPGNSFKGGAASNTRKAYAGTSAGVSIPLGNFRRFSGNHGKAQVGAQVNFLNVGYLFNQRIGVHASFLFGGYNYSSNGSAQASEYIQGQTYNSNTTLTYGGMTAGPLFAFPISDKLTVDVRPAIGIMSASIPRSYYENVSDVGNMYVRNDEATSFALALGTSLSYNVCSRFALSLNTDIVRISADGSALQDNLHSLFVGLGIAYVFNK